MVILVVWNVIMFMNLSVILMLTCAELEECRLEKGKVVLCNCDDPTWSAFWKYIPWSKGGRTVDENLQMLCKKCNNEKMDK